MLRQAFSVCLASDLPDSVRTGTKGVQQDSRLGADSLGGFLQKRSREVVGNTGLLQGLRLSLMTDSDPNVLGRLGRILGEGA